MNKILIIFFFSFGIQHLYAQSIIGSINVKGDEYFPYSYALNTPCSTKTGDICKISVTNGTCKYSTFVLPYGASAYPVPVTWNNINGTGTIVVTNTNQQTKAVLNVRITKQCTTTIISENISNNRSTSGCYINFANSQISNNSTVIVSAEKGITISSNTIFKEGTNIILVIAPLNSYNINAKNVVEDLISNDNIDDSALLKESLFQNIPNPFNEVTTINFNIPENAISSFIQINGLYGNKVKTIPINQNGIGQIQISCQELDAGMYTYSLIIDGKLIESKRMIVNK